MLASLASKAPFSLFNAKCSCCQKIFLRCWKPNCAVLFCFFLNVPYVKNCSSSVGGDLICHIMWDAGLNLDPTGAWFVSWTSS